MSSVEFRNCNNVSGANLMLAEGETTVLFGMNGSGKSALANAIMHAAKGEELPTEMSSYGTNMNPSVTGVSADHAVLVFNEDYIEETLFRGDAELIADGYAFSLRLSSTERRLGRLKSYSLKQSGSL